MNPTREPRDRLPPTVLLRCRCNRSAEDGAHMASNRNVGERAGVSSGPSIPYLVGVARLVEESHRLDRRSYSAQCLTAAMALVCCRDRGWDRPVWVRSRSFSPSGGYGADRASTKADRLRSAVVREPTCMSTSAGLSAGSAILDSMSWLAYESTQVSSPIYDLTCR